MHNKHYTKSTHFSNNTITKLTFQKQQENDFSFPSIVRKYKFSLPSAAATASYYISIDFIYISFSISA